MSLFVLVSQWWPQLGGGPGAIHVQALKGAMDTAVVKWEIGVRTAEVAYEGAAIADVDGDGRGELFFGDAWGTDDNYCFFYRVDDGSITWSRQISASVFTAPAIGDLDGDGQPELALGALDSFRIVSAATGATEFSVRYGNGWEYSGEVADMNGDGVLDVVWPDLGGNVIRVDREAITWRVDVTSDACASSVALGDATGDGVPDAFVGDFAGVMHALNGADGSVMWSYNTGVYAVDMHPAVWDVDRDGRLEVLFTARETIYCLDAATGAVKWQAGLGDPSYTFIATVDGDRDGVWEVYVGGGGTLYAFSGASGASKWTLNAPGSAYFYGIAAADIDGDGGWELICSTDSTVLLVVNAATGQVEWTYDLYPGESSVGLYQPTVGDVDGDGCSEVVVGTLYDSTLFVLDDPHGAMNCGQELLVNEGPARGFRAWAGAGVLFAFLPEPGELKVEAYDGAGRLERRASLSAGAGLHPLELGLGPGVHLVRLSFKGEVKSLKLIVK